MNRGGSEVIERNEDVDFLNREYDARSATKAFDREGIYRQRSKDAWARIERIGDVVYDAASGSKLDIYPAQRGAPLFVWFHGGYWRSSTKNDNAFVAPGLVETGIAVANVDYTLAPAVKIGEIVRQVRASVAWLSQNQKRYGFDARRIHVGGHSAGGHLVGMLLANDWQQRFGVRSDIIGAGLAVSGLFDLAPLRRTFVNEALGLDDAAIRDNSPINFVPHQAGSKLLATVGGLESSEFQKQTNDYLRAWQNAGNLGERVDMPGFHHFDIILELERRGNALFDSLHEAIRRG
jgi:arylformamidase